MRCICGLVVAWAAACGSHGGSETVTVTVTSSGSGAGTIATSDRAIDCGDVCVATLPRNSAIQLIATADAPSSQFAGWTGGGCEGTETCEIVLAEDVTVDAAFATVLPRLGVVPSGNGAGTVTSTPAGIDCGSDCEEQLAYGTSVELVATAEAGSSFMGWSGGCSGVDACTVMLDADVEVTARFALDDSLVVTKIGTGMGQVTSTPVGIDCGAECEQVFPHDTMVTLVAAPIGDATFAGWSGDCAGLGVCNVTIDASKSVTATFTQNKRTLTVVPAGSGEGSVTSDIAGITCGADCSENYDSGSTIVLTAAASIGSTFTGWSGGGCSGTDDCEVTVSDATTVTATFTLNRYDLSVARAGSGTGTVTSTPAGISCGSDCTQSFDHGQSVVLSATAAAGSNFIGWSGEGCSGTGTCTVMMTDAGSVTAAFAVQDSLTVTKIGTGAGRVTSSPAGIDCGADCTQTYPSNTVVTLTATPIGDATFTGWSGACTGMAGCSVTIDGAKLVTASFTQRRYTLTVMKAGSGAGSVSSSPAGIACGTDCAESYSSGTTVVLTATPSAGSIFAGWSGACSGIGTCTVTMTAARTATATFTRTYALTVARAGTGAGVVTSMPAGINCGSDCSERYNAGQVVQLSAVAALGSEFIGWSGGCSGAVTPCSVTMNAAVNVTASFRRRGLYYTILDEDTADDRLQYIQPATSTAIDVGQLPFPYQTGDCAWNPTNGMLYAITRGTLFRVDVATNTAQAVGSTGLLNTNSLVFYKGALYGIEAGYLYRYDMATGAPTSIGALGYTDNFVGLAWDTARDRVIAYRSNNVQFYAINMTTGAATIVGSPGGTAGQGGMTYDPIIDRFVVVATTTGTLERYNPVTFARTNVGSGLGKRSCIAFRP